MKKVILVIAALWSSLSLNTSSSAPLPSQEITIIAVGDTMLAGSGSSFYHAKGFDYPFAQTSTILKSGDITVANLEAPITSRGKEFTNKQFRFRMKRNASQAIRTAGVSVVTLANNHMLDYGEDGLKETVASLDKDGIAHTGAGATLADARLPAILNVKGKKVAFLAYSLTFPTEFWATATTAGTAPGHRRYVEQDIARAKAQADIVVVSFHWGAEKETRPKKYQKEMAHLAIDAGADLIIGHHPHVLQGLEIYKGRTIFYSLGNFAFGCMSPSCKESLIARIRINEATQHVELVPINVANDEIWFQPAVFSGARAEALFLNLNVLCAEFGTKVVSDSETYRLVSEETSRHATK